MIYLIVFKNIIQMQMVEMNSSYFDKTFVNWITILMISINWDKGNKWLPRYALIVNLRQNKTNTIMMNKKESTKIRERDGDTAPNRNTSNGEGGITNTII